MGSDGRAGGLNPTGWRVVAQFDVTSDAGDEFAAMQRVAEVVGPLNVSPRRVERLKTAVAEAPMKPIEHGNHFRADLPVAIEALVSPGALTVRITDQDGGNTNLTSPTPDLNRKLTGEQSPRVWGLFLIENRVDARQHRSERGIAMAQVQVTAGVRRVSPKASVIDIAGHDTAAAGQALGDAYNDASAGGVTPIVLNIGRLDYMNSSGIGLLVTLLGRANDPMYERGFFLFAHRRQEQFWRLTLRALACHVGATDEVRMQRVCLDPRWQRSQARNVWQDAAIRTGLYLALAPARWARSAIRRR